MKYKLPFIFALGIIIWLLIPYKNSYADDKTQYAYFMSYSYMNGSTPMYTCYVYKVSSLPDIMYNSYDNYNIDITSISASSIYQCLDPSGNSTNHTIGQWTSYIENGTIIWYSSGNSSRRFSTPIYAVNCFFHANNGQDRNDVYNPEIPTPDIYQCAFFFEPAENDLFSMYCFPQELDDGEVVTIHYNNLNNIGFEITSSSVDTLKRCYIESGSNIEYYHSIEYWLEMIDQIKLEDDNVIDFLFTTPIYAIYCDFIENNGNPNYNIFPLTEKSWWDDIVNEIGFEDTTLGFIWEWLFGNPDPDYHNVTIDNSPSPTPLPTPKPYNTVLKPDGNGGYEFQYEYEDENGNTITASAPPEQPIYDGNDLITQPINMNISGVPVSDVEGVQSLLNVIGEADEEYQEGFQVIGKSFAVLPSKWFLFFGIPAAIILIAGIIKSLLG